MHMPYQNNQRLFQYKLLEQFKTINEIKAAIKCCPSIQSQLKANGVLKKQLYNSSKFPVKEVKGKPYFILYSQN